MFCLSAIVWQVPVYIINLWWFVFFNVSTLCYKIFSKYCFRCIPQILTCHIFIFIGKWRMFWLLTMNLVFTILNHHHLHGLRVTTYLMQATCANPTTAIQVPVLPFSESCMWRSAGFQNFQRHSNPDAFPVSLPQLCLLHFLNRMAWSYNSLKQKHCKFTYPWSWIHWGRDYIHSGASIGDIKTGLDMQEAGWRREQENEGSIFRWWCWSDIVERGERKKEDSGRKTLGLQHSFKKDSTRLLEIFKPNPHPLEQASL